MYPKFASDTHYLGRKKIFNTLRLKIMENVETGKDKIKKICEILKNETLEPAKQEAQVIIENAKLQAEEIIQQAKQKAETLQVRAKEEIEKEKSVFQEALRGAAEQAVLSLKQSIDEDFFNKELYTKVEETTSDPKIISKIITALIDAIEKEGVSADFSALIPEQVSTEQVNTLIAKNILKKLKEGEVTLGGFSGGVQMKLRDKKVILDISDVAIHELLAKFLRKDFRKLLFAK